ncbi:MAG: ATP-binding protein [Candidatus Schekmanbacteria bacterium]|nr:ATP-binding protein [Candidatus Schekmanbacteria bacterium]
MPHTNPLVDFLRHYGPIAVKDNQYDERIGDAVAQYGVEPIIVPSARLETLLRNFRDPCPKNVILTGTAGDGKTFCCRQVFEQLGGNSADWARGDKTISVVLPARAAELVIIKDLSGLTDADKQVHIPEVARAFRGEQSSRCYLIAANDGQLLATWRRGPDQPLFREIESMLVDEREEHGSLSLRMYNLSRGDDAGLFEALVEKIISHPDWRRCDACPAATGDDRQPSCPILVNRQRLDTGGPWQLRSRLRELIELVAANDQHLPIRQLLLLVVNVLLGDATLPNPVLNCNRARRRAAESRYEATNPYGNVFGGNLNERERAQHLVFAVLLDLGVGRETESEVDDLLVFGEYEAPERFRRLVKEDERFGDATYARERERYLNGERRQVSGFLRALEAQRRRLFFEASDGPQDQDRVNRWRLTAFRHAGEYLQFRKSLRGPAGGGERWSGLLTRGLNRTFSGMMIDTTSELYLAAAGGDGRGRVARFLAREEVPVGRPDRRPFLLVEWREGRPHPQLTVLDDPRARRIIAEIELRLTHFEYLMRVASGSLPASFSRQCYEDLQGFKLRLVEALERLDEELGLKTGRDESCVELLALEINPSGSVEKPKVIIRVPRDDQ